MTIGPTTAIGTLKNMMLNPGGPDQLTDGELLRRFVGHREEAAFAALMRRHGPLVWGTCLRRLENRQEAEDVFQATFLVLAGKAATIRKRHSVASWLYGVASRLSLKVTARAARQRRCEQRKSPMPKKNPPAEITWRELCAGLDEELSRLPEKYRAPLVLCYLEDKTQDEAATHLDWPRGTLKRRLEKGRELLRDRLGKRGLTLSAALIALMLTERQGSAMVTASLALKTVRAATGQAAGRGSWSGFSISVIKLAKGMLHTLTATKMKVCVAFMVAGGFCASEKIGPTRASVTAPKPEIHHVAPADIVQKEEPVIQTEYQVFKKSVVDLPRPAYGLTRVGPNSSPVMRI